MKIEIEVRCPYSIPAGDEAPETYEALVLQPPALVPGLVWTPSDRILLQEIVRQN
jgi:hypothetical protein